MAYRDVVLTADSDYTGGNTKIDVSHYDDEDFITVSVFPIELYINIDQAAKLRDFLREIL